MSAEPFRIGFAWSLSENKIKLVAQTITVALCMDQ